MPGEPSFEEDFECASFQKSPKSQINVHFFCFLKETRKMSICCKETAVVQ